MKPVRFTNDPDSTPCDTAANDQEYAMGWFGSDVDGAYKTGFEHGLENSSYRLDTIAYSPNDAKESAAYRRGLRAGDRARERRMGNEVSRRRRNRW